MRNLVLCGLVLSFASAALACSSSSAPASHVTQGEEAVATNDALCDKLLACNPQSFVDAFPDASTCHEIGVTFGTSDAGSGCTPDDLSACLDAIDASVCSDVFLGDGGLDAPPCPCATAKE